MLVVDRYGITLRVLYGKLHVEDGIGPHRRSIVLDRAGSGSESSRLERIVLLGKTGSLTLDSLAWLRAIGAAFVHLAPDGAILTTSHPYAYEGLPIRRAQALAVTSGLHVAIARDLIARKLDGQRCNCLDRRSLLSRCDSSATARSRLSPHPSAMRACRFRMPRHLQERTALAITLACDLTERKIKGQHLNGCAMSRREKDVNARCLSIRSSPVFGISLGRRGIQALWLYLPSATPSGALPAAKGEPATGVSAPVAALIV